MSRTPFPYYVSDIAQLAHTLRHQLDGFERTPSHVEMLNLLSKAGGYRNFQHFRAQRESQAFVPSPTQIDVKLNKKLLRHFDQEGRLVRWPGKFTLRMLCLWVMWSHLPARATFTESEINALLEKHHLFQDPALLRRELADRGFVLRTADGRQYTRIERQPPAEAIELFRQLRR